LNTQTSHRPIPADLVERALARLGERSVVLVGMPGAGKSTIGRRLGSLLRLPFVDADHEIERAAAMTIPEIFEKFGEAEFREGEKRVIARLLEGGRQVIATGGGAFMAEETRAAVRERAVSVWLKADVETLLGRVRRKSNRPLLAGADPEGALRRLLTAREPVYATADVTVQSRDIAHDDVVAALLAALARPAPASGAEARTETGAVPPHPHRGEPPMTIATALAGAPAGVDGRETVTVGLGARAYDILIGRGLDAGAEIAARFPGARASIVTDTTVAERHLAAFTDSLAAAGLEPHAIIVPPGEGSKSFRGLETVVDGLLDARRERGDLVVALGGGVIGDLAGFAAGIVRRGMRMVQVPTTVLAQVDSSVGGKTGINARQGKNLVGVFHQPSLVLADLDLLATLPERHCRAGYAEIAKYGLIDDPGFFAWLEGHGADVVALGDGLAHAVATSCRAKARVVAADEHETTGARALLNLGHTFGHALEAGTGYGERLVHGEAVALGMAQAFRFSAARGLCSQDDAARVERHLRSVGLPTRLSDVPGELPDDEALLALMAQDKKVVRGKLVFILATGIGGAFLARDVPVEAVRAFLAEERSAPERMTAGAAQ
jgi:shikimate kinase/3-dehydroquinate synthase